MTFSVMSAVAGVAYGLMAYSLGLGVMPFLVALPSLRVGRRGDRVVASGLDAEALFAAGFALVASPAFFGFGVRAGFVAMAVALVLAASFRVRVVVTASQSVVTRTVLFVVPWRRVRHAGRPQVFVDGWGDFADPEAIHLGFDGEDGTQELAWVNASGAARSEAFMRAFSAAVDAVQPARP